MILNQQTERVEFKIHSSVSLAGLSKFNYLSILPSFLSLGYYFHSKRETHKQTGISVAIFILFYISHHGGFFALSWLFQKESWGGKLREGGS